MIDRAEKNRRNMLKAKECKLHDFDIPAAIQRERTKQEKFGVILGNISAKNYVLCRCKNCGAKMALWYAGPYMDGRRAAEREAENDNKHRDCSMGRILGSTAKSIS